MILLTEEQQKKLHNAELAIADVQIEMLRADDSLPKEKRNEQWRRLFGVRVTLAQFIELHRPKGRFE